MRVTSWVGAACLLLFRADAQNIGTAIGGTIRDPQGLAVERASIEVVLLESGARWDLITDRTGSFDIAGLPAGVYRVTVTAPGFARMVYEPISLTVSQKRTLRVELAPAIQRSEITVTAEALGDVGLDEGGVGRTFNRRLMGELPVVSGGTGRNFVSQVLLTPGVTPAYQAHRPFATAGARSRNNNYMIDSTDYNEIEGGLLMGRGVSEQLLPLDSIEGMQVLTHNYKAEYGRNNGAVISVVTRRGTNHWNGSLYHYLRNERLDARNAFDPVRAPLKANTPGAAVGGPLLRDRLFVFANYEGLIRRFTSTSTIQTLRPEQKAAAAEPVKALAALYVDPNVPGTNLHRATVGLGAEMHNFVLRGDGHLSDKHRATVRSIYLDSDTHVVAGAALSRSRRDIGSQSHALHHNWTPSHRVMNEARVQFSRFRILDRFDDPPQLGDPARNGQVGAVFVPGLTPLGHFFFMAQRNLQNSFQWSDDLTIFRGGHAWKAGAAVRRQQLNNGTLNSAFVGQLRFLNIGQFLAGRPVSYSRNIGTPFVGLRRTETHAYVQDDWRLRPGLTLSLGLRYELNTIPYEVNGLIGDAFRFRGDHNNFAPRFGIAWTPRQSGETVVRAGYGVYYNVLELSFVGLTRFNPPLIRTLVNANPRFPDLLAGAQTAIPSGLVLPDPNLRTPYAQHFNLQVERQLFTPAAKLTVGYLGTVARKLPRAVLPNGGDGLPQARRPDPAVGVVIRLESAARSRYDGLEAGVEWQRKDLLLRASYAWSKFLDEVSDFPTTNTGIDRQLLALEERNWRLNWGPSDFDVRHVGSVVYSYVLPFYKTHRWLGGWQIQGIVSAHSGRPFTLFSGTDNPVGVNNNRILHVPGSLIRMQQGPRTLALATGITAPQLIPVPGQLGTLGRNTERSRGLFAWNASLFKAFAVAERVSLQLRGEVLNLLNNVNYGMPDGVLTSPNFGQAIAAFDPRQVQFGLRLSF
jgi:hypothetical protein